MTLVNGFWLIFGVFNNGYLNISFIMFRFLSFSFVLTLNAFTISNLILTSTIYILLKELLSPHWMNLVVVFWHFSNSFNVLINSITIWMLLDGYYLWYSLPTSTFSLEVKSCSLGITQFIDASLFLLTILWCLSEVIFFGGTSNEYWLLLWTFHYNK